MSDHIQAQKLKDKFSPEYPILMFPLRVETRFIKIESTTSEGLVMDASTGSMTSVAQLLENVMKLPPNMDAIDRAISGIERNFASIKREQNLEAYEPTSIGRWKVVMLDTLLDIHGKKLLANFRSSWQKMLDKNQATNELLVGITGLKIKENEKIPLWKKSFRTSLQDDFKILIQRTEHHKSLEKFTGEGLMMAQSEIFTKVKLLYDRVGAISEAHPEDWKTLKEAFKLLEKVEVWNEEGLIQITEYNTYLEERAGKVGDVQKYFNKQYRQNLKLQEWSPAIKNWKQVMVLKERFRLFDIAQQQHQFQTSWKQLKALRKQLETFQKDGLNPKGLDDYTIGEFGLLESKIEQYKNTLNKNTKNYSADVELYTKRIGASYAYLQELLKQDALLTVGKQSSQHWESLAKDLETKIYAFVFNQETQDFDRILEQLPLFYKAFFQLSFQLIKSKFEKGKENATLQLWLPRLEKAFGQLMSFLAQKERRLAKQIEKQQEVLVLSSKLVRGQVKKLKKVAYLQFWKQLQTNYLAFEEQDDFSSIRKALTPLAKKYTFDDSKIVENQHFAVAELIGKQRKGLFAQEVSFKVKEETYSTWKSFLLGFAQKLKGLNWKVSDKTKPLDLEFVALLDFWEKNLNIILAQKINSNNLVEQSSEVAKLCQTVFQGLKSIPTISKSDAEFLEKLKKGILKNLSKWIRQIESIIKQEGEQTILFQKEKKKIVKLLDQINTEVGKRPFALMWSKNFELEGSFDAVHSFSVDQLFQETVVDKVQGLFEELLELRSKHAIPSLAYNKELFKTIKKIQVNLKKYVETHQEFYSKIDSIDQSVRTTQKKIRTLLEERLAEEVNQDLESEQKVVNRINIAKEMLTDLSVTQPRSHWLEAYFQFRLLYLDISLQVEFIDVIPEEKSSLSEALESLQKAYEQWYNSLEKQAAPILKVVKKGVETFEKIKAASVSLGVYTNPGTGTAPVAAAMATNPITTITDIICNFPLFPPDPSGPGGPGGGGGGTDDPVLQEHELWIRVYPDYAAITSHDKRLTSLEVQAGIDFWTDYWFAAGDRRMEVGAWRILVEKFGVQRAAWIAKKMRPTNWNQKPTNPITVTAAAHTFLQQKLGKEHISAGLTYWETAIPQINHPEVLKSLKANLEKKYDLEQAALITHVTKTPLVSQALNPLNKSDKIDLGSKKLSAKTINAVIRKVKAIEVNQMILPMPLFFPQFPTLDPVTDLKTKAWDSAPFTNILPDQLVFIVYDNDGNLSYEKVGQLIPAKLQTGPDPNNLAQYDPTLPDLGVGSDIKWMTDFQEAVDKGMAIRIPVLNEEADPTLENTGFSKIYVTGVKHFDAEDPVNSNINTFQNTSANLLDELLEGHHYVKDGMSILKPGTPTNTTSDYRSPFAREESMEASFEREILGALPNSLALETTSDGHVLAKALGINTNVFHSIENNSFESIKNTEQINTALWMTTWGYFLEEMDNHKHVLNTAQTDPLIPQGAIDSLKDHFIKSIKGRGALPAIRIGKQPYGILPTSSFHRSGNTYRGWAWDDILGSSEIHGINEANFYNNLTAILLDHFWGYRIKDTTINKSKKWLKVVDEKIHTVDDPVLVGASSSPFSDSLTGTQERFMEVLRLHPRSVEFYTRYGLSEGKELTTDTQQLSILDNFTNWLGFSRSFGYDFSSFYATNTGNQVSLDNALISNFRLLNPVFNDELVGITSLKGPIVDDKLKSKDNRTLSSIDGSNLNYIEWLLQAHPRTIYTQSKAHAEPSKSLLYHSLKNALMNQYWDTCARILEDTKLTASSVPIPYKDLMFRHNSSSTKGGMNSYRIYQHKDAITNLPDVTKQPIDIDRTFNRGRYRDFVIDVVDRIKGANTRDPIYADELVFANGKWPIMNMMIKSGELINHSYNQRLIDFVHQGVHDLSATARVHYSETLEGLLKFRAALAVLAQLPTAELEHLFAEHIDLASHRLDAWVLGLANKRLEDMRAAQSTGIYLGAYGWLLNLKPGNKREELGGGSTYHVKADGSIPEMTDLDNQGHIIAPSLNHAITGAVLKSGFNAHLGSVEEGTLAINLSSKRIRKALFYLEGIRNGQPLGALLGYQLERDFIENGLGQYIQAFREVYPLNKIQTFANVPQTDLHNTIDGQILLEAAKTIGYPYNITILPTGPSTTKDALIAQVDKLFDAIDALGDLAIAEGTYHVVGGNYARAGAMLKALSQQNHIPEPEVIQTPRTGQSLTHRVGMIVNPVLTSNATSQWAIQLTTRAQAEPTLNAWLAEQLPNAVNIRTQVYYKIIDPSIIIDEDSGGHSFVSIADLEIEPIDLLYLFPDKVEQGGSELEKRIKKYVIDLLYSSTTYWVEYDKFVVDFETRDPAWPDTVLTIVELSSLIYALRDTILKARPMTAIDIIHPSTNKSSVGDDFQVNIAEVQQRVQNLHARFVLHKGQLLNNFESLWLAALDGFESSDLNIETNPTTTVDYTEQLARLQKSYAVKLAAYQEALSKIQPTQHSKKQFLIYQEAAQALLGKSFRLLPHFTAHNNTELQNCYTNRNQILPNKQALELEGWMMGLSRIRDAMNNLEQCALMQSILGGQDQVGLSFAALQLPYRSNDHWVGLEVPDDYYKKHQDDATFVSLDKLSLVLNLPSNFSTQPTFTGLIVDEWTELIPNDEETIGVAFHYDEPNAEPPQAILLAVHPETGKSGSKQWDWKQLKDTLHSTLALAQIRGVEPDHLQSAEDTPGNPFDAYAHILPATYTRLQENNAETGWYTDYGLNIDDPVYDPHIIPGGGGTVSDNPVDDDIVFTPN